MRQRWKELAKSFSALQSLKAICKILSWNFYGTLLTLRQSKLLSNKSECLRVNYIYCREIFMVWFYGTWTLYQCGFTLCRTSFWVEFYRRKKIKPIQPEWENQYTCFKNFISSSLNLCWGSLFPHFIFPKRMLIAFLDLQFHELIYKWVLEKFNTKNFVNHK